MKKLALVIVLMLACCTIAYAETRDATVTTDSGTYTVPVEVDGGEVTHVYWPNGGAMNVYGGELDDGFASGTNSRGDYVSIEVDDYDSD